MLYYKKTPAQTLKELDSTEHGLAESEAQERLRLHGHNSIQVAGEPLWRKLFEPFANVFMAVLLIAVVVSILQHALFDAAIIGIIMAVSAIIYYIQRFSTERVLRTLRKHEYQVVDVLRENRVITLDTITLVPGDVILLHEGDKIPADGRLLEASNLRVDESQLTGESLPITKEIDTLQGSKEVYEQSNMVFQGSFVVAGEARVVLVATGNATTFGRMAALTKNENNRSPVQQKVDKLIAQITAATVGIAVVAFLLSLFRGVSVTESIQFVLALSVSAVPESLPVAISIILVLGIRRMAAKKALVRNMHAIESIGIATTIATDKTGTLTKNQLTVQAIWPMPYAKGNFTELLARSITQTGKKLLDPIDVALSMFADENKAQRPRQSPVKVLPFDQATAMSGNLWHSGERYELTIKGAPEHVLARCDLTENEREKTTRELHKLAGKGYRVLALAHTTLTKSIEAFGELPKKHRLSFFGFVAIADVLRPEAKKAIQTAISAGVSVRIVTGDHFETAYHIGRQLGVVKHIDEVFDSRHMHTLSDSELEKFIEKTKVFSRVIPEHKYRLLSLLKKKNITAMTGDGVNDVPALAGAHVGIAMGSGASIAKDAGDIVLIDNNFKSIVDAIKEGRAIYANIRRMLYYLLSTNAGEVLVVLGALLIGLPMPLLPLQILWINLITDTSMVIPLGLEPGEKDSMQRPPERPNTPILSRLLISRMVLIATVMAILTLVLYGIYSQEFGSDYGRTIAFSALVIMQWANAFGTRSEFESVFRRISTFSAPFYIGFITAVALQMLALFSPLGKLLHITPVALGDLAITGLISFGTIILFSEVHKYLSRKLR